jgi:hypothetical protein
VVFGGGGFVVVFGGGAGVARVVFGAHAGFLGFNLQHSSLLEFGPHCGAVGGGRYVVGGRVARVVTGAGGFVSSDGFFVTIAGGLVVGAGVFGGNVRGFVGLSYS